GREAAVVVFKSREGPIAQYIPMVQGLRKRVRQSGLISDLIAHVVFEGDEFDYALGDRPYIHHKPSMKGGRRRPVVAAYSIARFKDGTLSRMVMNIDEIEDIRTKSRAKSGPWNDPIFFPEMCIKTVVRNHVKQLPMSSDLVGVFAREDAADRDDEPPPSAATPVARSITHSLEEFGAGGPMLSPPSDRQPAALEDQAGEDQAPQGDVIPGSDSNQGDGGAGGFTAGEGAAGVPGDSHRGEENTHEGSDESPEQIAYRRGKEFKTRFPDANRRALPGEYRDGKRTREALAWQAGFDGAPLPSFQQ